MMTVRPRHRLGKAEAERLEKALDFAIECHGDHTRKGTRIPYLSHLLQVSGLVLESGGSVDQAIAGLLHDTVEDCDDVSVEMIRRRFGPRVASIVADCTDLLPGDNPNRKGPWRARKERYLRHLAEASRASLLVSACDKLHNLGTLVADVRTRGARYLDRFNSTPAQQLWYYQRILQVAGPRLPKRLRQQFEVLLGEFEQLMSPRIKRSPKGHVERG
jgi:(p)ppGpp synthase/HD superfamily hydrolase